MPGAPRRDCDDKIQELLSDFLQAWASQGLVETFYLEVTSRRGTFISSRRRNMSAAAYIWAKTTGGS